MHITPYLKTVSNDDLLPELVIRGRRVDRKPNCPTLSAQTFSVTGLSFALSPSTHAASDSSLPAVLLSPGSGDGPRANQQLRACGRPLPLWRERPHTRPRGDLAVGGVLASGPFSQASKSDLGGRSVGCVGGVWWGVLVLAAGLAEVVAAEQGCMHVPSERQADYPCRISTVYEDAGPGWPAATAMQ